MSTESAAPKEQSTEELLQELVSLGPNSLDSQKIATVSKLSQNLPQRPTPQQIQGAEQALEAYLRTPSPTNVGGGPPPQAFTDPGFNIPPEVALSLGGQALGMGIGGPAGRMAGRAVALKAAPYVSGLVSTGLEAVGAGAGTLVGELMKAGQGEEPDIDKVQSDTLITFLSSGGLKGLGFTLFKPGRVRAVEKLGGKYLGKVNEQLSKITNDPNYATNVADLRATIQKALEKVDVKAGPALAKLRFLDRKLSEATSTTVDPRWLVQHEQFLGSVAKYAKGEGKQPIIVNKAANEAIKAVRSDFSDRVDKFAVKYGFKEYPRISKEVSLAKKAIEKEFSGFNAHMRRGTSISGAAIFAQQLTGNPLLASGAAMAGLALSEPIVNATLHKVGKKLGVDTTTRLMAAEAFRQFSKEAKGQ